MAKIGNWGTYLRFQTSDSRVLTFNNFKRKSAIRVNKHNMVRGKPKLEFMGGDLQSITFKIELNAILGVEPRKEEEKLLKWMDSGVVAPLVIGGRKICSKAMLTGASSAYDIILEKGEVLSMSIDVTMTEYQ